MPNQQTPSQQSQDDHSDDHDQHASQHRESGRAAHPEATEPAAFWDAFYGSDRRPWSGRPNALLVEELDRRPMTAGTVLDLGCGTGGDAVWFAGLGWTVTAVDISAAALAVGAEAAGQAGVAERITWTRCDLNADFPTGRWDLVVSSYLQSPVALDRERVLQKAAGAVASGGTLLVHAHERFPAWHQGALTELPTTTDVLATLKRPGWAVERAEPIRFAMASPEGIPGERFDHVIRLRRERE